MWTTFSPSIQQLVSSAIKELTPFSPASYNWKLTAAASTDQMLWLKLDTSEEKSRQVMVGIPVYFSNIASVIFNENADQRDWSDSGVRMTDVEQLSRCLPEGDHKLVIAPVAAMNYGEVSVAVLY